MYWGDNLEYYWWASGDNVMVKGGFYRTALRSLRVQRCLKIKALWRITVWSKFNFLKKSEIELEGRETVPSLTLPAWRTNFMLLYNNAGSVGTDLLHWEKKRQARYHFQLHGADKNRKLVERSWCIEVFFSLKDKCTCHPNCIQCKNEDWFASHVLWKVNMWLCDGTTNFCVPAEEHSNGNDFSYDYHVINSEPIL